MATSTFTVTLNDQSQMYDSDANYTTAHDAATGTVNKYDHSRIGQYLSAGIYRIYRCAFGFDTSALADDALIQSASITGYSATGAEAACPVILKDGTPTYPTIPTPVVGDYEYANYSGNGATGTIPVASHTAFTISFNYIGLSWISKTGYSKFLLVGEDDANSTEPTGLEFADFYTYRAAYPAHSLKLTIVHFPPTSAPTVGDPTYSNTKATYTKATANVTDEGGGYEERGFQYGISETPTWSVGETGVWGTTGDFSLILPNLLPLTTYYARAYVVNDYGTGYSDWTSFTTTDVPTYGMYEDDNTANICFYVRKVGGKWSIKHGPYTVDQTDIEITKMLTDGTGKYQIKFETDALCSIACTVMTKMDIKAR